MRETNLKNKQNERQTDVRIDGQTKSHTYIENIKFNVCGLITYRLGIERL